MRKISIEIEEDIYQQIETAIKDVTGAPVREAGRIITPLTYPAGLPDWVADVMANNIANIVRHQPTVQLKAIQDRAKQLEEEIKALMRPKVSVT